MFVLYAFKSFFGIKIRIYNKKKIIKLTINFHTFKSSNSDLRCDFKRIFVRIISNNKLFACNISLRIEESQMHKM